MQRFVLFLFLSPFLWSCDNGCNSIECENAVTCHEGECVCAKWYTGDRCQLQYNRNYEGEYVGTFSSAERSQVENLIIEADEEIPNRMILPMGVFFDFIDEESLVIPRQQLVDQADTFVIEGEGTYSTDALDFSYSNSANAKEMVSFSGKRVD